MNSSSKFDIRLTAGIINLLEKEIVSRDFIYSDLGVSSRVLSHWEKKGLLPKENRGGKMHRFNFVELLYLYLVIYLREFGYPLNKIKIVKEALFEKINLYDLYEQDPTGFEIGFNNVTSEDPEELKVIELLQDSGKLVAKLKETNLSIFEITLFNAILFRKNIDIYILLNGQVIIYVDTMSDPALLKELHEFPRIVIPLNKIILSFISNPENYEFASRYHILNPQEQIIMEQLRKGKAKTVTIKFKNGKPELLKVKREIQVDIYARLSEVLMKGAYEKVIIDTNDGTIVYSSREQAIKLQDK